MDQWEDNQPIYRQLRSTVVHRILHGSLAEGEAVPSVRQVAADQRVNPITVSKAYQLLVDEGLLAKRRGLGMYVCEGARDLALTQERKQFLAHEWPRLLERINALDLHVADLPLSAPNTTIDTTPKVSS